VRLLIVTVFILTLFLFVYFLTKYAVQKLYNEAKDHKLPMEVLNRYGGKFIKEVKVSFHLLRMPNKWK